MIGLQNGAEEVWSTFEETEAVAEEAMVELERGRLICRVFELF